MKIIRVTEVFSGWFDRLRDNNAKSRIQARIDRAEHGNYGDCKPVGEGVCEMRIDYGPGYRVYFVERGREVVVLLAGGTKDKQSKDIAAAIKLSKSL